MGAFHVEREPERIASINRTIRFKPELYDWLNLLSESTGVSFNKLVNQCIQYALDHSEEPVNREGI